MTKSALARRTRSWPGRKLAISAAIATKLCWASSTLTYKPPMNSLGKSSRPDLAFHVRLSFCFVFALLINSCREVRPAAVFQKQCGLEQLMNILRATSCGWMGTFCLLPTGSLPRQVQLNLLARNGLHFHFDRRQNSNFLFVSTMVFFRRGCLWPWIESGRWLRYCSFQRLMGR